MLDKSIFLTLDEVADNLPELDEAVVSVAMDDEQAECYKLVEDVLKDRLKEMLVKGDKRLLGKMLMTLLLAGPHCAMLPR